MSQKSQSGDTNSMVRGKKPEQMEKQQQDPGEFWDTEEMLRLLINNSPTGIFIIDESFLIIKSNNMLSKMLGQPPEKIAGSDFRRYVDESSREMMTDRRRIRQGRKDLHSKLEINFYREGRELRHGELSLTEIRTANNKVISVGQLVDITDRKKAESEISRVMAEMETRVNQRMAELKRANDLLQAEIEQHKMTQEVLFQNETKYRHLIDNANSIILELDKQGNVLFMNDFGLDLFGYKEEEVLGRNVVGTIVPPVDSAGRDLRRMMAELEAKPEKFANNENENMKRNGERVWMVWTNQPIYDEENKLKEILCIGINYTKQKMAEELYAQELKEKAAAEERTRLARDLHDAVSQTLFSASIIAEVLPRLWERNPDEGRKRLEEIRQLTRGALAEMRTLLLELRPSALFDAEPEDLLRQFAESITGRARIPVKVEVSGNCPAYAELKTALYRITQEALNNVAKHSKATRASVILQCGSDNIELIIEDNGRGFEIDKVSPGSLGLGIMQERARSIGASLEIESQLEHGTKVKVVWKNKQTEEERCQRQHQ